MDTKKEKKPKAEQENVNDLPVIDLSSCEQFDPSKDQFLDEDGSCDEDFDIE